MLNACKYASKATTNRYSLRFVRAINNLKCKHQRPRKIRPINTYIHIYFDGYKRMSACVCVYIERRYQNHTSDIKLLTNTAAALVNATLWVAESNDVGPSTN